MNRVDFTSMAFGLALSLASVSRAGTFNLMGLGSQNQAMANATAAVATDAFSQTYNPALMSFQEKSIYSLGFQGLTSWFQSINQVITDSPTLGGPATAYTYGDVPTYVLDTDLVTFAYQTPLNSDARAVHIGLTLVTPIQHIFYITTPDPFEPGYSQYLADTQRFTASISLSQIFGEHFAVGISGNIFFTQGLTSDNRLPANKDATNNISAEIKPAIAPAVGVVYFDHESPFKIGVSYRGKEDYQTNVAIFSQISLLGNPGNLDFSNAASVYYDPDMLSLAVSREDANWIEAVSAKCEFWGGFSGGMSHMTFQNFQTSFSQTLASTPYQNIVTLHAGVQRRYAHARVSGGYAYVPTPVPDQSGPSNLIDSDKHELYFGYGWTFNKWLMEGVLRLDGVVFFDYLTPKTIAKVDGTSIGAPGYQIGGNMYGYGLTLTREY